jgi:rhodanese-related sulfurtransferase
MRYVTLALAFAALLVACSKAKTPLPPRQHVMLRNLLPEEFAKIVNDTHAFVVNVERSPTGVIPGTKLVLSGEHPLESLEVAQPDYTKVVAVYCSNGTRSDTIADQLARAGYANVCFLQGGYSAWVTSGLPFRLYNSNK